MGKFYQMGTEVNMPQTGQITVFSQAINEIALLKHFPPWWVMLGVAINNKSEFASEKVVNDYKNRFPSFG